jgi:uncharacterized membrane protein YozB (DUF420 family)
MNPGLKKIIFGLAILSSILFVVGLILFKTLFPTWYFSFFPLLVLIFLLINSGFYIFFHRALKRSESQFIRSFMLTTGIKLMLYLILVLTYVLTSPQTAISFSVTLSILYIAYTAYDLFFMLTMLKRKKEINTLVK